MFGLTYHVTSQTGTAMPLLNMSMPNNHLADQTRHHRHSQIRDSRKIPTLFLPLVKLSILISRLEVRTTSMQLELAILAAEVWETGIPRIGRSVQESIIRPK